MVKYRHIKQYRVGTMKTSGLLLFMGLALSEVAKASYGVSVAGKGNNTHGDGTIAHTPTHKHPTLHPTLHPTSKPSTHKPSTKSPSTWPTTAPSMQPSTSVPTDAPSSTPSSTPTASPSMAPSNTPSQAPSMSPSMTPSSAPSAAPSMTPSKAPWNPEQIPVTIEPGILLHGKEVTLDIIFANPYPHICNGIVELQANQPSLLKLNKDCDLNNFCELKDSIAPIPAPTTGDAPSDKHRPASKPTTNKSPTRNKITKSPTPDPTLQPTPKPHRPTHRPTPPTKRTPKPTHHPSTPAPTCPSTESRAAHMLHVAQREAKKGTVFNVLLADGSMQNFTIQMNGAIALPDGSIKVILKLAQGCFGSLTIAADGKSGVLNVDWAKCVPCNPTKKPTSQPQPPTTARPHVVKTKTPTTGSPTPKPTHPPVHTHRPTPPTDRPTHETPHPTPKPTCGCDGDKVGLVVNATVSEAKPATRLRGR